ncbi:fungal-specific transcription factor domain-containing protein [Flagelloscypha sp. PMI_526]|nr:fungal-specific transcription factor domain-containing protein [Flagelloscypha sp. PMI_526]
MAQVAHVRTSPPSLTSPTGILISRRATRIILAGDSSVHRTQDDIVRLRERSLQLEDALAFAHSHTSKDVHPLLAEGTPMTGPQDDPEVDKVTEVLGTLTVGGTGELKYFGPSAVIEPLHQSVSAEDGSPVFPQPDLDSTLQSLSTQTPFGSTLNTESFISTILKDLPERMRAWLLCETFYELYPIYSMPIQEHELMESYLSPVYKYLDDSHANQNLPLPSITFCPHRCAVIFLVFALGAWLDATHEDYWVEANRYFRIGLSCLSMQSIFYSPEVASVQALFLLTYYNELRGSASTSTISSSWTILSLACKISQGLGLHRDPSHWNLDKITVDRRRWLYWELVSMEIFHCLGSGRPLSNRPSFVDTELPDDVGRIDAHGEPLQGFFRWKHEVIRDCYLDVTETLLAATPAKYDAVLELDRKVRAKEIPAHLNRIIIDAADGPSPTAPEFMHTCMHGVVRSYMLLSIHRHHLTEALQDSCGNPLKSRYAPSFLASHRAASWIIKSIHAGNTRFPVLFGRLWHPWTVVLTAAMVLGSIAIHVPSSLIGNSPLEELRVASSMFEEAAVQTRSHRTKNGAKIVQEILAKAEEAQTRHSVGDTSAIHLCVSIPSTNFGDDELAIFGGQDRLFQMNPHQAHLQSQEDRSSHDSNSSVSFSGLLEESHPSLIEFLNSAPMTQVASSTTFQEVQATSLRPPLGSPFRDPGLMPLDIDSWPLIPLATSQPRSHFRNVGGPSTTELHNLDTFENYLTPSPPIDFGPQPSMVTPWQEFMIEHSLP